MTDPTEGFQSYSDLVDMVRELLPANAPTGILLRSIRNSARRLCEDTEVWESDLAALDLKTTDTEYVTAAPSGGEIYRILEVYQRTADEVTASEDGAVIDPDCWVYDPETLTLTLSSEPNENVTDGLLIKAVIVPEMGSTPGTVPNWLLNRYHRAIAAAAASELCGTPRRLYSNESLSKKYEGRYRGLSAKGGREFAARYKTDGVRGGTPCRFVGS